ncbi:MAG TPA: S9 family peptidase [Vicinamibacterales bacterium]|nr:S9 family peptidase [Vicinamibacterales bacterium]
MTSAQRWRGGLLLGILILVPVARAARPPAVVRPGQAATGRRPLTIEDYYRIPSVGAPQISPDSKWVSFAVSTRVEETNGQRSESYYTAIDGTTKQRPVLHGGKPVSGAAWTPGSLLRYSVEGASYTFDPANPSAPPVKLDAAAAPATGRGGGRAGGGGRGGAGAAAGTRSPDGQWVVAARDKAAPPKAAVSATDFEKRHQERFKGAIIDWKDFQRDASPFPAPDPHARPAAQLVLQPVAGGPETRILVDQELRPTGIAWHPNGKLIAFVADPDWKDELKYESPDLYTVTTDGALTRVTNDGYVYSDLSYSPDGRYLSYARTFGTDMVIQQKLNHGGPRDVFVRPVAGGAPINLTASWDLEPGATQWSPDSRYLYFSADVGGEAHWFRVSVPGAKVEQLTKGERTINGVQVDRSFTTIVYTVGTHDAPNEIYAADIDGSHERQLTNVLDSFMSGIDIGKTDRLRWPSVDGTPIEGWLTYPAGFSATKGPYPLIVFSHGGPHANTGYNFDFKKQFFAANGYFVLDTNFRSSTGYGEAFKWATWGAWGDKDGQDVISGIDYVLKRYPIDAKRVGHTGHSYGGFMTDWLITQYPDRFAAAIAGAGISDWISDYGTADIYRTKETEFFGPPWDPAARARMIKQSPISYADRVKTPTLFVGGEVDQRVPIDQTEEMYFALKRRGIPSKMIRYADQPHGISGNWNNVHRMINELAWWEKYLKGAR